VFSGLFFVTLSTQALTLEQAIDSAIKVDPSLRASKFNVMAAGENIAIARSRLLPQVSLQGSSNQLKQTTSQELADGGISSRSFSGPSVNHQFVIRQALLRPKELSALSYAELQTQYMEIKYKSDVRDLRNRVINVWIDLLGSEQIAQAFERPLKLMHAAAEQERLRYEQGDSTKDAAIEAAAQYENSRATHIQALETLYAKQSAFENLTKIPAINLAGKKLSIETLPVLPEIEKADLWVNFRENSLELQMTKLQEMMQLERVNIAQADHKPTLDFLATFNLAKNDATSTQGYQYRNKQLGVQYTVPIYSGGGISASVKQTLLNYEIAMAESEIAYNKVQIDFETSINQLIGNKAKLSALLNIYNSGLEQARSVKRNYELGVKTLSDVASVEVSLSKRENELIIALQEYLKIENKINKYKLNVN
jgi:outer membrane protein TolC